MAPNRPDEITSSWLNDLLRSQGVVPAPMNDDELEIEVIGQGFLGTVARVRLPASTPTVPVSLVLKFGHGDPEVRAEVFGIGGYQRETWFYRELAEQIPLRTATCWFAHTDAATDQHLLVFDDLSDLTVVSQLDGCPIDRARAVVDDLATLHSQFWGGEGLDELPRADEDEAWFSLVDQCVDATLTRDDLSDDLRTLTRRHPTDGRAIVHRLAQRPTLVHADARIENVFFAADGTRTWIDWDGVQIANGAAELAYFLSQSVEIDVRRAHEGELLERYHQGLVGSTNGPSAADYSAEDCLGDYRLGLLAGWSVGMAAIAAYGELDGPAAALVTAGIQRVAAAVDDHHALDLLR